MTIKTKKTVGTRKHDKIKNAREFCRYIKKTIYPNLNFNINYNAIYNRDDLLDSLTHTAMTHDFTQNGSRTLGLIKPDTPAGNTILYHIKKLELKVVQDIFQKSFEAIYREAKTRGVFKEKVDVAIDITDQPYYGNKNDPMVVGTKHQRGTSHAFRFATINIVDKGRRFTLMALPMSELTPKEKVVKKLIDYAKTKIRIKNVYLDRGFFTCKIINLLNEMDVKFLMPAIKNPRIRELIDKHSAPAVIDYKMGIKTAGTKGRGKFREDPSHFNLVIVDDENGIKIVYATNLNITEKNAYDLLKLYKKRWGIETSYRMKGEFKPKTTSKYYIVRLFYFLFSACLYNLWVLANIIVGFIMFDKIVEKPFISAKIFGTVLHTTFCIDDGG